MQVCICAATYNRPEGLARLLDGLGILEFKKTGPVDIRVIVVDNDPDGTARTYCEKKAADYRWTLEHHVEQTRGISAARNTAVSLAKGCSDFIAFIDDDEAPEPNWLDELLDVQRRFGADVVTGPVVPSFEDEAPPWVTRGRFFDRERYQTGRGLDIARTGNVLISCKLFNDAHLAFGERYSMTGGEDTNFFMRAVRAGYSIAWADEAVVHEWVPRSRMTAAWVLRRAYRGGKAYTMCVLELDRSVTAMLARACKGAFRIIQGALGLPPSLLLGWHSLIRALQKICMGTGSIAAVFSECLTNIQGRDK